MCMICNGLTPDQLLDRQVENIETHGFTLLSVTGEVPWTYSIGLRWRLDIPELIVVGWPAEDAAGVIHRVVETVEQERVSLRCGSVITIGEGSVGFGHVDPENLAAIGSPSGTASPGRAGMGIGPCEPSRRSRVVLASARNHTTSWTMLWHGG